MKRMTIIGMLTLGLVGVTIAQSANTSSEKGVKSYGLGVGLPYGGMGLRLGINVADRLNLFGGAGYQLAGIGYNVGLMKDFRPIGVTQLYVTGMYGSNAAIRLIGASYDDKVFLGPSAGGGIKINSRGYRGNYIDIGVLYPFTSSTYQQEFESIKNSSLANRLKDPWPVLVVIGYVWRI